MMVCSSWGDYFYRACLMKQEKNRRSPSGARPRPITNSELKKTLSTGESRSSTKQVGFKESQFMLTSL